MHRVVLSSFPGLYLLEAKGCLSPCFPSHDNHMSPNIATRPPVERGKVLFPPCPPLIAWLPSHTLSFVCFRRALPVHQHSIDSARYMELNIHISFIYFAFIHVVAHHREIQDVWIAFFFFFNKNSSAARGVRQQGLSMGCGTLRMGPGRGVLFPVTLGSAHQIL